MLRAFVSARRGSSRRLIGAFSILAAMAFVLISSSATPAATPVAAYAFDEGSGTTVADVSGNGNNGTVANTTWVTGKNGKALSFNGTSARVTIPDSASLHLSSAMTLEAWVNPATTTAVWRDVIYKGNDNYYLEGTSETSGRPGAGGTFGTTIGTAALAVNTWTHLAVTYDKTTVRLYVNGTQVSSRAATANIASSTNPLTIGSDPIYGQFFRGLIDDVRIYNVALTQAQIQTDMATPVAPPAPDTTPPSVPGTLTANAISGGEVDLGWGAATDNVGVTGYHIERCQGAGCTSFAEIGTTGTTTSYNDITVAAGTSYNYRVRANDAALNLGPYSNTATAITPSPDTTPPSAPGTLTANAISSGEVDLGWGPATDDVGVTGYHIERCQGAGCTSFAEIGTSAVTTSYNDTTVAAGTSYNYRVRANDAALNLGPYSNTASATTPVPSGPTPVAAYAFDEGLGTTVADVSGNGNNGTVANTTWVTGKNGKALSFNGTSARVTISDSASLHLSSAMTLEAWVNPATTTALWRDVIYKGNDNYYLEGTSDTSGRPGAGGTFGTTIGTAALAVNTWAHLAVTYDKTTVRLYVNGAQVSSLAATAAIATSTNPLSIGSDAIWGQYFNGLIDDVRVYNVALTAAQIQTDMATPVAPPAPDTTPPSVPGTLTANAISGGEVDLGWGAATDNVGVTGYHIERRQGAGRTSFAEIGTTAATTSYNDITVAAGTSYNYRVRANDAALNLGPYSNTATATTPSPDTTPPSVPGTLTANAISGGEVDLGWGAATDDVGVTGYRIERCQGAGCTSFAEIGTSAVTTSYNDTTVAAGTSYNYRVRANDAALNLGPYSNTATATTPSPDTTPPSVPGTLTANAISGGEVDLGWGAATDDVGVTGYHIERCQGAGCTSFAEIGTSAVTTSYNDTTVTAGNTYNYRVRANDAALNLGPYSNTASATTPVPSGPTPVAAYAFDEGSGTTVADVSGNGNNGTVANTTWVTGKNGKALSFNGTSARVTISDSASLHLSSAMTLEAWVNPATTTALWRDVIYKGNDNYYLEGTSEISGRPGAGGTFGTTYGTAALAANTWAHLAVTYDRTTVRLYVNGTQVSSLAATAAIATSTNPLSIGSDAIYGQFFSGLIDDVRIYNVALTQAQIQTDMATPVAPPAPDTTPPSVPGTLIANAISGGEVDLGWGAATDNVGVTGYHIERCQGAGCTSFAEIGTTAATTSYNDTTVTAGTSYNYRVRANDAALNLGPYSNTATAIASTGLTISPRVTDLTFTRTQQFTVPGTPSVNWSVDGVVGGAAGTGTITSAGLYTPPSSVGTHTVTATTLDQAQSASATVYVTNYTGTFTYHNDNARTGGNLNEIALTQANVNQATFGKQFSYSLDGIPFASPLYVANVNIPGKGFHNVVYVATEHDSVFALDADGLSSTPLWQDSFINPAAGITPIPPADTGETKDIPNEIGITGTPVIDPATNTIYLVAATKEVSGSTTNYVNRLHALDLATGAEKFGGPVVITATVNGTGVDAQGGQITFNNVTSNQRAGLLLVNGEVCVAFANHGFNPPYHGWVMAYNPSTLHQDWVYCSTPNAQSGGIWMGGDGVAADSSGSLYFSTGNGTFDQVNGGGDYGDSVVKLSPSGTVSDYFTPYNYAFLDTEDVDLGSGGIVLLPDQSGAHTHELIAGGKGGTLYVIDRDNMGHVGTTSDNQIAQSLINIFPTGNSFNTGNYSAPVYYNGSVFYVPVAGPVMAFAVTDGRLSTSPTSQSSEIYNGKTTTFSPRGGEAAISANGSTNGILWALESKGDVIPGVLHAYDPTNLGNELYNSSQAGSRDALDPWLKFTIPTVANGRVYVVSAGQLTAYGLLP